MRIAAIKARSERNARYQTLPRPAKAGNDGPIYGARSKSRTSESTTANDSKRGNGYTPYYAVDSIGEQDGRRAAMDSELTPHEPFIRSELN